MQPYLSEIFERLRAAQKENLSIVCPRCGRDAMHPALLHNCLSRDTGADIYVCTFCGTDEALRDLEPENKMRLTEWAAVKKELKGKTFLDLLCSGRELDCDLIIGNTEMPATFVWNGDSVLIVFGAIFYAKLLESPYIELPNGNIEILCDDYELGEHFTLAASGAIGLSEYYKLFGQGEHLPEIFHDRAIHCEDDGIEVLVEPWFDAEKLLPFPIPEEPELDMFYVALYHPVLNTMKYICRVEDDNGIIRQHTFDISEQAQEILKEGMDALCLRDNGCSMKEWWDRERRRNWFVTDDSCWQCCREVSDKVFELIQICDVGGGYDVARTTINLDDYTIGQWEYYAGLFHTDGFRGFISDNDMTFPMRVLAEYIFETDWEDFLQDNHFGTFDAAARHIAGVVDCEIDLEEA